MRVDRCKDIDKKRDKINFDRKNKAQLEENPEDNLDKDFKDQFQEEKQVFSESTMTWTMRNRDWKDEEEALERDRKAFEAEQARVRDQGKHKLASFDPAQPDAAEIFLTVLQSSGLLTTDIKIVLLSKEIEIHRQAPKASMQKVDRKIKVEFDIFDQAVQGDLKSTRDCINELKIAAPSSAVPQHQEPQPTLGLHRQQCGHR